jgi:hypothetical protein
LKNEKIEDRPTKTLAEGQTKKSEISSIIFKKKSQIQIPSKTKYSLLFLLIKNLKNK